MNVNFFRKYKLVWLYGLTLAILLVVLRWLELKFLIYTHAFEIYAGIIAVFFTGLGIWLSGKLTQPKTEIRIIEKTLYRDTALPFEVNRKEMEALGISERELEVLQLLSQGMSNQEIGAALFVSLNTIKTHVARIFEKLEVQRRTQAVEKAKKIGLIA